MVSFQRMKDELEDLSTQVSSKMPVVGKCGASVILAMSLLVILVIGIAIGFGINKSSSGSTSVASSRAAAFTAATAEDSDAMRSMFVFVSNNTQSCPELGADRLLSTVAAGTSFEGLVVTLSCQGDYNAFPNQVKCIRKADGSGLQWSHVPVCYPSVLVGRSFWDVTLHTRSVSCSGDATSTKCQLACIKDYVAVEQQPYVCSSPPCPAWSLGKSKCFLCDQKCAKLHAVQKPQSGALLESLGCSQNCPRIVVESSGPAAIWQNKRTGLFEFSGEHNGRPVYQNNATKEFLFYTFTGSEWLVGPDFRKPHAGIQIFGNDDTSCPERFGGRNVSKFYIDSSQPSPGGSGKWLEDPELTFTCFNEDSYKVALCSCSVYKVFHTVYTDGPVPNAVAYLTGLFSKSNEKEAGLLAPLYLDMEKQLYLYSHHPKGRVWQVSTKMSTTPMRGVLRSNDKDRTACPDDPDLAWEWFNTTTADGQQLYVEDKHIHVKCLDSSFSTGHH